MSDNTIIASSGNVFEDLGLPDSQERLFKSRLAQAIGRLIEERSLTQAQVADLLEIDQPKVSHLQRGRLAGFSVERLFRFLQRLGQDVEVTVKPTAQNVGGIRFHSHLPQAA